MDEYLGETAKGLLWINLWTVWKTSLFPWENPIRGDSLAYEGVVYGWVHNVGFLESFTGLCSRIELVGLRRKTVGKLEMLSNRVLCAEAFFRVLGKFL